MSKRALRLTVSLLFSTLSACGADIDLGGSSDAAIAPADAAGLGVECAPCTSGSACASGACAPYAGDLFCVTSCSSSTPCTSGHVCTTVTTTSGTSVQACVPTTGACAPASPPTSPDGAVLDTCGPLNGPNVTSHCSACGKYSNDCQPNGCYGGYWCNESARDCHPPPASCP